MQHFKFFEDSQHFFNSLQHDLPTITYDRTIPSSIIKIIIPCKNTHILSWIQTEG